MRDWEPATALFGREATEAVARGALPVLAAGGSLVLEVGDGQAGEVGALLGRLGYREVAATRDLAGPRPRRRGQRSAVTEVDAAVAAIRAGRLVVLPTDTVYGLAADGRSEAAATALYAAKGRASVRPTALLFATVELLVAEVPELDERASPSPARCCPGRSRSSCRTPGVASRG